jgi:SAM-dependent methyltransferase
VTASGPDGIRAAPVSEDPVGEATLDLLDRFPSYARFIWERVSRLAPIRGRVLEMGCGIGTITRLILATPGVEAVDAVDISPQYIERVRSGIPDPRLRAILGSAESFRPGEGIYDRAISINVLEHVEAHRTALENIARSLRPGGACLLLVPAHPWLFSALDRNLSHFRRYSRLGLADLARSAGLEPIRLAHFNPLGAFGWWLNGKLLRRPSLPERQVALNSSNFMIGLSRWLDRLNPFPLGISVIARLEKPARRA